MKRIPLTWVLGVVLAATACKGEDADGLAANDDSSPATETNAAPVPCDSDDECPDGIACVRIGQGPGHCDVDEMLIDDDAGLSLGGPSLGVPAPCERSSDCPDGIECVLPEGVSGGTVGYCDVDEMIVQP